MDKNPYLDGTPEEFIEKNMGLAQKIASKFYNASKDRDINDLLGIAYYGLAKAYAGFNPTGREGVDGGKIKFSTYAGTTIKGYIMTHIRQVDHSIRITRKDRDLIYAINSVGLSGNETVQEIATKCGISFDDVNRGMAASIASNVGSMDYNIGPDDSAGEITLHDVIGEKDIGNEDRETIKDFAAQLSPRLYDIYKMRMVEDVPQREVSEILGISRSYVSRLEQSIIKKARKYGENERRLDYEESRNITEGEHTVSRENASKMRREITTLSEFNRIGTKEAVARLFGVSASAAYLLRRKLEFNTPTEVKEQAPTPPELYRAHDYVTEAVDKLRDDKRISDMTDYPEQFETKDDLEGIADPEPKWEPDELENIEPMKPSEQIRKKWQNIEAELVLIRMLYKEQAEELFNDRLAQAMRVMAI